jgi:phosphopantetheinyl transferase
MIIQGTDKAGNQVSPPGDHALIRPVAMPLAGQMDSFGQVCLAAAPLGSRQVTKRDFRRVRELARSSLVRFLLSRGAPGTSRVFLSQEVKVSHDPHGKPHLLGPHPPYPAVSFSYGMNCLWGAMGKPGEHLGLDVAEAGEFPPGYPYHRLAAAAEWAAIKDHLGQNKSEAAALLWAAKEAAVKAWGCGYRGLSPFQIKLAFQAEKAGAIFYCARLEPAAEAKFWGLAAVTVAVDVWRRETGWLALGRSSQELHTNHCLNTYEA